MRGDKHAPADLRERSLDVTGAVLDMVPGAERGSGRARAAQVLQSGAALRKFLAICDAQGGFAEPGAAQHAQPYLAPAGGLVTGINNRHLARIAKLAGAPKDANAGVTGSLREGDRVRRGDPLFVVHAESRGELAYALEYAMAHPDTLCLRPE